MCKMPPGPNEPLLPAGGSRFFLLFFCGLFSSVLLLLRCCSRPFVGKRGVDWFLNPTDQDFLKTDCVMDEQQFSGTTELFFFLLPVISSPAISPTARSLARSHTHKHVRSVCPLANSALWKRRCSAAGLRTIIPGGPVPSRCRPPSLPGRKTFAGSLGPKASPAVWHASQR